MKCLSTLSIAVILSLSISGAFAKCFTASGQAMSDAQSIRKMASSMGWKINMPKSITAGNFIKAKAALYPQGMVEVCLREDRSGKLVFRAQSSSSDAGEAEWRNTFGKKKQEE